MEMKQCPNGHFYDQSKTRECPYCNSASANVNVTRPIRQSPGAGISASGDIGATVPANQPGFIDHTRPASKAQANDSERTAVVIKKDLGIDPVVGWLVCVDGKGKGRDYRMHSDNNYIGRSENMDICMRGDDTISRENHAVISYDMRENNYYFSPCESRNIVRVNGKAIFSTIQLSAYDNIELGSTKLIFLPLCGEAFSWK